MAAWAPGFTWRNPGHAYSRAAVDLEGCVHDPGGMVVPLHLLVPAGERRRWWLEQMVHIRAQERRPLFSWGFGPN